ncbi:MAG TPA: CdaR family transcriptional regulator [Lachnospiraceae bacterium]|nr:CdaR family transcriptional regulator [Lachnospiraceae bacterium]
MLMRRCLLCCGENSMIPRQIINRTIENLHELSGIDLRYYNPDGDLVAQASSDGDDLSDAVSTFAASETVFEESQGYYWFKLVDGNSTEGILTARGEEEKALFIGKIALSQLRELMIAYRDHFSQSAFMKNLLLGNLLLVDIYKRARNLQIVPEARRVVYIAKADFENMAAAMERLRKAFAGNRRYFVTTVDEKNIVLIQELTADEEQSHVMNTAAKICDTLETAGIRGSKVAYGLIVPELQQLPVSYRQAKLSLEIGSLFYRGKRIHSYDKLGIGHLLYQVPPEVCRKYLNDVFLLQKPDELDRELVMTANAFFDNNLSIAETARQLFVHRNTLIYRLDKLAKNSGLDIRSFEDALTFKIGLMVYDYLTSVEQSDGKR